MSKTIKETLFRFNLILVISTILITGILFSLAARYYVETETIRQLHEITRRTEGTINHLIPMWMSPFSTEEEVLESLVRLGHIMKEPGSVVNAENFFVTKEQAIIRPYERFIREEKEEENIYLEKEILKKLKNSKLKEKRDMKISTQKGDYVVAVLPIGEYNKFGVKWMVIYSSLEKLNSMQNMINLILLGTMGIALIIVTAASSYFSTKISKPITLVADHIKNLSDRDFRKKISLDAGNEVDILAQNVNFLADKLDVYDKSQKIFLQNASHEFRTPLMSIQSYVEGIKYDVVEDKERALEVILAEVNRLSRLVNDLMYLSKLDTMEEIYEMKEISIKDLLGEAVEKMEVIALRDNKIIEMNQEFDDFIIMGDEEKLLRVMTNIISNGLRYAKAKINIQVNKLDDYAIVSIQDDGEGLKDGEKVFQRFFKGEKGNFGLGLSIAQAIVEKHSGKIVAKNTSDQGAVFEVYLKYINRV